MTDPHVARLHAEGRAVLVQPYVAEVDSAGETGIVFVGDEWTHAFRKGPIQTAGGGVVEGWYREEHITSRTPTDAEFAVAESALDALGSVLPGASGPICSTPGSTSSPAPMGPW